MKPAWDLREKEGVVALARKNKTYKDNNSTLKMLGLNSLLNNSMVKIPNRDMYVMKTEVTQLLYETVIGENPSKIDEMDHPVENVSWFDAVYFCNKLSLMMNLEPVYIVNNGIVKEEKNPEKWNYIPHQEKKIEGVSQNLKANGYRLPTVEEWQYAAEAGTYLKYSGDNTLSEVGWYSYNSKGHKPVATKQPNRYGLYDLSGNVREWCSDYKVEKSSFMGTKFEHRYYYCMGGSYVDGEYDCNISRVDSIRPEYRSGYVGFRICRNYDPEEEQKQRVEVIELKNQIPQQIGEKLQTLLEFPIVQRKKNA
ncbi:MAG: SUMF1/EgtB/PvdO family nonheme iron enzyme, partial [Treponema sp.]|nr:SUMF1/EgtB/PvdO family nonheme iron enzyme [Treponema sp.]